MNPVTSPPAGPAATKTPPWKNPFVIAFVLGAVFLTVLPFLQRLNLRAPPPLASLGAWTLTDENGAPLGSDALRGKVWVASFFFTRCPTVCPAEQRAFVKILDHTNDLPPDQRPVLVSITVDPEHDVPAKLEAYKAKMGVADPRWKLATGPRAAVEELVVQRMKVDMGDKKRTGDLIEISHASKLALVDQNGDLRGFWDLDEAGRGNLITAARMLVKHGPTP